jgi:hypothetical protein
VFTRSGSVWTQQAELVASDGTAYDFFGGSVSVSGDTVVVGASQMTVGSNVYQGAVYVFTRSGSVWTQEAKLVASDGAASDFFGNSVALLGDTLFISATVHADDGAAYVFGSSVDVLGFEDAASWTSSAGLTLVSSPKTQGSYAMSVGGSGYREVSSVAMKTSQLQGVSSNMALDVYIPTVQSNPYWLGQVALYVSCPSANLNNAWIGAGELTGKLLGQFTTVQFSIPDYVKSALLSSHDDLSFKIVVNANDPGYVLDNLRFVP